MPGSARVAPGGFVYHVLNRSVGRMHMFRKEPDFEAFERVMVEAHQRQPIRILSCCVLSTIGTLLSGRRRTANRRTFSGGSRPRTPSAGAFRTRWSGTGACIKGDSRDSRYKLTTICLDYCAMSVSAQPNHTRARGRPRWIRRRWWGHAAAAAAPMHSGLRAALWRPAG